MRFFDSFWRICTLGRLLLRLSLKRFVDFDVVYVHGVVRDGFSSSHQAALSRPPASRFGGAFLEPPLSGR